MTSFETVVAYDRLADWVNDYDMSPQHTSAMLDLISILQVLIPSSEWIKALEIVNRS